MGLKRVSVMNTAFRDGFQSVFGARVFTPDFLPALEAARDAGFTHFEAGGGARYQSLYLYCREDAFDMMDTFRATVGPDARLQTLARGVNVVGLDSQSSDIIDLHARLFKRHGITTIRNFDALNDVRNLAYSGKCIVDAGLEHEVVVAMMGLPPGLSGAHTAEFYVGVLRQILDAEVPYTSVCFKDASGTAPPQIVYETVREARKLLGDDVHLRVHTHETAGTSVMVYRAALDAGADGIDLSMSPCSGGTSQPDVVTMWQALRGTGFDLGLDIDKVLEAEAVFEECMQDYLIPPEAQKVHPITPFSPMPGGALTANTQMMRDNGILARYPEVIAQMPDVVRRGGFGTSVTPVSQFYFQQAFNNMMFGPWERLARSYARMVLGYFGRTPVPPDPELVALASKQLGLEPTDRDPREINDEDPKKGIAPAQARLTAEGLPVTEETTFIAATCGDKGVAFLKGEGPLGVRKREPEAESAASEPGDAQAGVPSAVEVIVNGRTYTVGFSGNNALVAGRSYPVNVRDASGSSLPAGAAFGSMVEVKAELAAHVIRFDVSPGDAVSAGDVLLVLEALKMEMEIKSPSDGVVEALHVKTGEQVPAGTVLVTLR